MHIASERTRRDMEAAAELRALGATWDTISEVLARHPYVVRRWTHTYRDDWDCFIHDAEQQAKHKRGDDARAAIRAALRHENPRLRRAAAENLLREIRAEQAAEPVDPRANMSLALRAIEQMTDEELNESIAEFLRVTRGESAQGTAP